MRFFKKKVQFKDFIFEQPKQLTPKFCEKLIDLYETNSEALELRNVGRTIGSENALNLKQSEDLYISESKAFLNEDRILVNALGKLIHNYVEYFGKFNKGYKDLTGIAYEDSGFQIQKTTPSGFYDWHSDAFKTRYFTYIFYLNDIHNNGETEFSNGLKIKPRQGKAIMFPASWEYVHRGIAPKNEIKYIATGWVSAVYPDNTKPKPTDV